MSPNKDIKFPPLTPPQKQSTTHDHSQQNYPDQTSEKGKEGESAVSDQIFGERKVRWTGTNCIYSGPQRKPQFLLYLENYVNKELLTISPNEPKFQELKLQVYRNAFCNFIKEFKTYQPFLSAIKKEYENTLAHQQDHIRELEPLRSHLRQVTEECHRKIQARWGEEQAEIGALKRENQQLQEDIDIQRKKEIVTQAVVDRLQSELSNQYLQYREEHDARKLLIWQLNDLKRCSVKEEHPVDENTGEVKDPVQLQLALKVCRQDLTKAQEELDRMKSEYWDVVPRRDWDSLDQTHKQTLHELKTLQGDFDQLKGEYDTLLEIYQRGSIEAETHVTAQKEESVSQGQNHIQSNQVKEPINCDASESGMLTVQEFRAALNTAFPLKSDEEIDELVASAQSESDSSNDCISSQRLRSLLAESAVNASPARSEESEENAASNL